MGHLEADDALADRILRDIDLTLIAAADPPTRWSGDAERFLRGVASHARIVEENLRVQQERISALRQRQQELVRRCASPEQPVAACLRAAADELVRVNDTLLGARAELALLRAQRRSIARQGQRQLTRLVRWWRASGLPASAVLRVVPDRNEELLLVG